MSDVKQWLPRTLRPDGMVEHTQETHYLSDEMPTYVAFEDYQALLLRLEAMTKRAESAESDWQEATNTIARIWEVLGSPDYQELKGRSIYEVIQGWIDLALERERRLGKTENQNRFLRYWIRELREDGADAVVDPLYGMLRDRITELAKEDPAADSPEGARLTALADLCEAYEKRRGESAVGIVTAESEVNSKSRLKRVAMQRAARESDAGVERQDT